VERRRFSFIFAVCLTGALLAGCGRNSANDAEHPKQQGRSPAAQSSSTAPAPQTADVRPVIVAFGDSLTAGVVENTYPQYLQDLLDKNGYLYRVENQGVSGDTTTDGLARVDNVIDAHPALVILEFGGNDGLRGIPVDSTEKNLEEMIVRLQSTKAPIVLLGITLPPNYGPEYVNAFNAIYPTLARKYHLQLFPFLLANVYRHPEMMQPDGIHPSGEGNKIVARDVFALINPMLKHPRVTMP
jgi:acyl-CoA thioesterase-1